MLQELIIQGENKRVEFKERQRRNISYYEELNYEVELSSLDLSPLYDVFKKLGKKLD